MKFFTSFLVGLSLIAPSVLAHPLDLPFKLTDEHYERLSKRANFMPITGAKGNRVLPRLEVRQLLSQESNQWTLFLLAMQQFQAQSQSVSTSYYQISGIHGVPRVPWNNVPQCSNCGGSDGYCPHDSVLFPAWHRTYLALFEEELISIAHSIANAWPVSGGPTTRAAMQTAAGLLRLPYWDWAAQPPSGKHDMPDVTTMSSIVVLGPKGPETINNPLFRHTFQDPSQLVYGPFVNEANTLRWPTTDSAGAVSQENLVIAAMDNIRPNLQEQIYQLFTTCTDYLHFSNDHAGSSTTSCSNSLEGIHNIIHTTVGGEGNSTFIGGHMFYLSTAAFDPIFWLHHCNVDRIFAMWQTLHPNSYGASQVAPGTTWTIAAGTTQDQNSALTPFTKDTAGDFWTTTMVRKWDTTFKYTYPEFSDSDGSASAIASYVSKLYGPSATATAGSSKRTAAPEPVAAAADAQTTSIAEPLQERNIGPSAFHAQNGSTYQYVANIVTSRYALNGTYSIFLFMGEPSSEQPSSWIFDKKLIGPMGVLSQFGMKMDNVPITGSVPLTGSLQGQVTAGLLPDLTQILVEPYLKRNLQWRVQGPDGSSVDPSTIPDFKVSVYSSTATMPPTGQLPVWSEFNPLVGITEGKAGGVGEVLKDVGNAVNDVLGSSIGL